MGRGLRGRPQVGLTLAGPHENYGQFLGTRYSTEVSLRHLFPRTSLGLGPGESFPRAPWGSAGWTNAIDRYSFRAGVMPAEK
jgi:hypothetical protein